LWVHGGPVDVAYGPTQASYKFLKENKPELATFKVWHSYPASSFTHLRFRPRSIPDIWGAFIAREEVSMLRRASFGLTGI
jgi:hypothetical protein